MVLVVLLLQRLRLALAREAMLVTYDFMLHVLLHLVSPLFYPT